MRIFNTSNTVQIPPGHGNFCLDCCVQSGRGFCVGLITRPATVVCSMNLIANPSKRGEGGRDPEWSQRATVSAIKQCLDVVL
jgi:hypothetical protein